MKKKVPIDASYKIQVIGMGSHEWLDYSPIFTNYDRAMGYWVDQVPRYLMSRLVLLPAPQVIAYHDARPEYVK